MTHRTAFYVMVRRGLEPKSLGFQLGTGVALVRRMQNKIESTGPAFIVAVLLLAVLLGTSCTASAQANAPRLENALSAAFYCYDASSLEDDRRTSFKACLERFKAGRCGSDLECETFFGGSY